MAARRPRAPALILYTSGSTGRPKGALLSHRALALANESWAGPVMALDARTTSCWPRCRSSHSFGLNGALLAPLLAGATRGAAWSASSPRPSLGRHRAASA